MTEETLSDKIIEFDINDDTSEGMNLVLEDGELTMPKPVKIVKAEDVKNFIKKLKEAFPLGKMKLFNQDRFHQVINKFAGKELV